MATWMVAFLPVLSLAALGIAIFSSIKVLGGCKKDFINRLSDDILCIILSQLTTKEVVRTSILSRRWRKLYVSLPKLSFHCHCSIENKHLNQYVHCQSLAVVVDRFLQLQWGQKIKTLQLSFCLNRRSDRHLERWMHCIARLGIEELMLDFPNHFVSCSGQLVITHEIIFSCQLLSEASMLRSLCLSKCKLEPNFQGPFSSLMSLTLDDVPLVNGKVESILLSCPKLESLILTDCSLPYKLFIGGPELELKFLTISKCPGVKEIVLCAGNLTSFEYLASFENLAGYGVLYLYPTKVSPSHVPKLQEVYFQLNYIGDMAYVVGEVAKNMPQLESLYVEAVISEIPYMPAELPTFSNIRQLYLLMDFDFIFDVQQVSDFTIACPLLQRFHLETKGKSCHELKPIGLSPRYHAHLKKIEFGGFLGLQNEIELILYLLKSAVALEQMLISRDCRHYTGGGR